MPCGSNACLIRRMSASTSGVEFETDVPRLGEADAMLAADRALERQHAPEQFRLGVTRPGHGVGVIGLHHQVDVDVAVAHMTETRDRQREPRLEPVDQVEQLRNPALGHDDVVVDLRGRRSPSGPEKFRAGPATVPRVRRRCAHAAPRWRRPPRRRRPRARPRPPPAPPARRPRAAGQPPSPPAPATVPADPRHGFQRLAVHDLHRRRDHARADQPHDGIDGGAHATGTSHAAWPPPAASARAAR